jgi:hypothetical protein
MVATRSWDKSTVTEAVLSLSLQQGNITARNYRIPKGTETEPSPWAGEYITFVSHLERRFGTHSSLFFRRFYAFYRIKPSDLGPHRIQQIAIFVAFYESYLGCEPHFPLWLTLFHGRRSMKVDTSQTYL